MGEGFGVGGCERMIAAMNSREVLERIRETRSVSGKGENRRSQNPLWGQLSIRCFGLERSESSTLRCRKQQRLIAAGQAAGYAGGLDLTEARLDHF